MQELLSTSPIISMVNSRHQSASTPLNQDQEKQQSSFNSTDQFGASIKPEENNATNNDTTTTTTTTTSSSTSSLSPNTNSFENYSSQFNNLFQPALKIESNFSVNNLANLNNMMNQRNVSTAPWSQPPQLSIQPQRISPINSSIFKSYTNASSLQNESSSSESSADLNNHAATSSYLSAPFKPYSMMPTSSYSSNDYNYQSYYNNSNNTNNAGAAQIMPSYFSNRLPIQSIDNQHSSYTTTDLLNAANFNNNNNNLSNIHGSLSSSSSSSFSTSPSSTTSSASSSSSSNNNNNIVQKHPSNLTSPSSTLTNNINQVSNTESYEWMKPVKSAPNGKTRTKDKYRVVYSEPQRVELEKEFLYSKYITIKRKSELSQTLNLSERQIKIWFQNRRAKDRKTGRKQKLLQNKHNNDVSSTTPNSRRNSEFINKSNEFDNDDEDGEEECVMSDADDDQDYDDDNSNDVSSFNEKSNQSDKKSKNKLNSKQNKNDSTTSSNNNTSDGSNLIVSSSSSSSSSDENNLADSLVKSNTTTNSYQVPYNMSMYTSSFLQQSTNTPVVYNHQYAFNDASAYNQYNNVQNNQASFYNTYGQSTTSQYYNANQSNYNKYSYPNDSYTNTSSHYQMQSQLPSSYDFYTNNIKPINNVITSSPLQHVSLNNNSNTSNLVANVLSQFQSN